MIAVRKQHPTFGLGTFAEIGSRNPTVLVYVREFGDDRVLCVNNLSRFPQPVELDLRRFEGWHPIELTGRVRFPDIGVLPYLLTLAGHGFYWFELARSGRQAVIPDPALLDSALARLAARTALVRRQGPPDPSALTIPGVRCRRPASSLAVVTVTYRRRRAPTVYSVPITTRRASRSTDWPLP